MIDLTGVKHHRYITEMTDILCAKTQNTDRGFFQTEAAYFAGKIASMMRATIRTKDRGDLPTNIYALALATSGFGKGHSVSVMEEEVLPGFKRRFMEETMPTVSTENLWKIANERALQNNSDAQEEFDALEKEYKRAGAYAYTFDSATAPAVKQLRHKLLLADIGAVNLQIDEIGLNFTNAIEPLTLFLELYDQGRVKQKLTKNTADNTRNEEVDGKTPTNLLLFGTPAKLLDGGQTEEQFFSMLDTGYARRCLFGIGHQDRKAFHTQTAAEIYTRLTNPQNSASVSQWCDHFTALADPKNYNWQMTVEDDVGIRLLEYKIACEAAADLLPDHAEIQKAELSHRYFKALKLAGALAFIDQSMKVTMDHLMSSILLTEESGTAFQSILNREKSYVRLAKYLGSTGEEQTHADLNEQLPFYKSGLAARNEMMTMAIAWGYKNHIVIKKTFNSGIEFFKGETLKETDLSKMILSYSDHFAYNYKAEPAPFDQLHKLTQLDGFHWANHHFKDGHRLEEKVKNGFNMIVLDVDEGVTLSMAQELLSEFKFLSYTTKRHQKEDNGDRFRILLPINYQLELDTDDYREFMNNVVAWLPFKVDESVNQRAKKWETFNGEHHYNDGKIFDALQFIPRTSMNEEFKQGMQKVESLDNLERWFANKIHETGNRNNNLLKYALALVDGGLNSFEIEKAVNSFNEKLPKPLEADEIGRTIMTTVAKRFTRN